MCKKRKYVHDPHIFPLNYAKACAMNMFGALAALRYVKKRDLQRVTGKEMRFLIATNDCTGNNFGWVG